MKATQLRPGMIILHEGDLYTVHSVDHRTPGNKRGAMATKMRSLRSGSIVDYRFRAEDSIERAVLDDIEFEYLYSDTEGYHFMNTETFDQIRLGADILGDAVYYLIPNLVLKLEFYEGKPMGAVLPDTVDLTVADTEPTVQKATASAVMKPAKLETGLMINVPPFINNGDKVKVDTSEARYVQRAQEAALAVGPRPYFVITPQAILSPAFPAGSVFMSSAFAWTTSAVPPPEKIEFLSSPILTRGFSTVVFAVPLAATRKLGMSPAWGPSGFSSP